MKSRFYVIIDTESVVAEEEHRRFQSTERFTPRAGQRDSGRRRGQRGSHDPRTKARWMFQQITVASIMVCAAHDDGNIVPVSLDTFSAQELGEAEILKRVFAIVDDLPKDATELVTYGGVWADVPLVMIRAMKHGLTLPGAWAGWMPWGGQGKCPHIDLMRVLTGSSKMKASHMAEFAAVLELPVKITAAPWAAADFMKNGEWQRVEEMCESDCIATAMLFAAWRLTFDGRSSLPVVLDRICRVVIELCPGRGYTPAIVAKRNQLLQQRTDEAWRRLDDAA